MMVSPLCSLGIRRSTQTSMRRFSLKGHVPVKQFLGNSVKVQARLPVDELRRRSSTKSRSSDLSWSLFDSYRINLNQVSPLEFFGLQELPQPSVDQDLLSFTDAEAMQQDCHKALINFLDLVMIPAPSTPVAQFVVKLLDVMGYLGDDRTAFEWMDLPLVICREFKNIKLDVCIVDRSQLQTEILLVAQEHKMTMLGGIYKAQIQLVAGAIAAFDDNNLQRENAGLPPLAEKVIPGIIMAGTSPSFFKIPVTETLLSHIRRGTYPPSETCVTYCYSSVPPHRRDEGMKPLDNRCEILKCFEAFRMFVGK